MKRVKVEHYKVEHMVETAIGSQYQSGHVVVREPVTPFEQGAAQ